MAGHHGSVATGSGGLEPVMDFGRRGHEAWWTRDAGLKGEATGDVSEDVVMEQRKALEWIMDRKSDWDDVELST